MKQSSRSRAVLTGALAACLVVFGVALGGSLTPPGPPAPTMKTLDQVEARTPISSLPYTISSPGSYYLTGDLHGVTGNNGITVTTDNVTLDLNGFALLGLGANTTSAINAAAASPYPNNLTVRNGTIRDWAAAIYAPNSLNVLFQDLVVSDSGNFGIVAGSGIIRHVMARGNFYGIALIDPSGGTIRDCQVVGSTQVGIIVKGSALVMDNDVVQGNGGIEVDSSGNRIEGNHFVSNTSYGIYVPGSPNIIIKNTGIGNATNYSITGGNDAGPIGTAATATSPWANISN